jgi:sugar phosphate permease
MRTEWWPCRIFVSTWLAYAGFYFCRKNFSVLMPRLTEEESISSAQLANAVFLYSVFYCAGQIVSGLLSDRYGPRRVVTAGMLVSAAATGAMGFASSAGEFTLLQAANGFAQACGWPGLLKMMSYWFSSEKRGVTMAWWGTNYIAGGFLATIFATWAATGPVMIALGWRRGAWWPALVLAACAAVFWMLARDGPREVRRPDSFAGLREVIAAPSINAIAGMYFAVKLARYVFLFWLPLYMTERLGYGAGEAGYTSSIFELAGFGGALLAGYVSDRAAGGRRFPVGAVMMFLLAAACWMHPSLAAAGRWGNAIGIAIIGAMTFGPDVLMAGAGTQDAVRKELAATAGGYTNAVGSLGQVLSPYVASLISTRFGWDWVFYFLVVIAAAGGAILATQWNFRRTADATV